MAGASGAVARSTAALWLRHVTTWSTTRRPGHPRLGKTLRDVDFRRLPLLKGHGSTPSLQFLINVGHRQQAVFHPPAPLSGSSEIGAGLWGGLPRRVPPAWSLMRPPRRGPGPARLPACGKPRNGMRKRRKLEDRRIWKDRSMWKDV